MDGNILAILIAIGVREHIMDSHILDILNAIGALEHIWAYFRYSEYNRGQGTYYG